MTEFLQANYVLVFNSAIIVLGLLRIILGQRKQLTQQTQMHVIINSRMDELLAATKAQARLEGAEDERKHNAEKSPGTVEPTRG